MRKKEDLRIVKTKASLYRGLMELMKNNTFESIKVSEICSASLINRSTFYDHFNDKFELLQSLISDMREELTQSLMINIDTDNIKEYYMELMKVLLDHVDKHKNIYSAVVKINSNSIAKDMLIGALLNSISAEVDENFINETGIPTRTLVLFYASGIMNIILDELIDPSKFDKNALYNTLDTLIQIKGLRKKAN